MRNDKMRSPNTGRHQRKSAHERKILYKVMTRSGYVTVRSLNNISDKASGYNCPSTSAVTTNESFEKKNGKASVSSLTKSIRDSTKPHTRGTWLNGALLETSCKDLLKRHWKKSKPFSNTVVEFISYPFKVVSVHQLLNNNDYLKILREEVISLPFEHLCNDLHEFQQTNDLLESPLDSPALNSFLGLLKGPLLSWMQDVTGKKLSRKVTVTGSKYSFTNYLLCHDDNLSDRSIAFILYLSEDWSEKDGGTLQLFKCNEKDQPERVVHSVVPAFGSFVFFEVTSRSYHQVQEILSKDKVRLSINGWFHGDELPVKPEVEIEGPKFHPPSSKGHSFKKWVNPRYLVLKTQAEVKSDFGYELSVSLPEFFLDSVYHDLEVALRKDSIVWERCGPANQRNYEKAKLSTLPPVMQEFLKLMKSKYMFYFLSEVTVDINPDSKTTPLWCLEVQRWSPGSYTLVVDNDPCSDITGIDVHLYFNVPDKVNWDAKNGGTVRYLGPDKDSAGFLEQNAEIEPEKNALFLVAHIAGMKRVTKYIDHSENLHFHKIIATYSQG